MPLDSQLAAVWPRCVLCRVYHGDLVLIMCCPLYWRPSNLNVLFTTFSCMLPTSCYYTLPMCPPLQLCFFLGSLSYRLPEYFFVVGFLCIQVGCTLFGGRRGGLMWLAFVMESISPSASQVMPGDQLSESVRSGPCNRDCLVSIRFVLSVAFVKYCSHLFVSITFPAKVLSYSSCRAGNSWCKAVPCVAFSLILSLHVHCSIFSCMPFGI